MYLGLLVVSVFAGGHDGPLPLPGYQVGHTGTERVHYSALVYRTHAGKQTHEDAGYASPLRIVSKPWAFGPAATR